MERKVENVIPRVSFIGGVEEEQRQVHQLLQKYADVFVRDEFDLGHTDVIKHKIELTGDTPIKLPYCRIPRPFVPEVRDHLKGLLKKGIIRFSPWSFPVVLMWKASGAIRMCIDYRALNARTRPDAHPLHRIPEVMIYWGKQLYSPLSIFQGYRHLAIAQEDIAKTALSIFQGQYEYTHLPFGLTTAPNSFQRLMQTTLADFIPDILLVYLGDILIYAKDFPEYL